MKYLWLVIFLVGCSTTPVKPEVIHSSSVISPVIFRPEPPKPLSLEKPQFKVITEATCCDFGGKAYFAVDAVGYEQLAINMQELRRYILELQSRILFYQESVSALENLNNERSNNSNSVNSESR